MARPSLPLSSGCNFDADGTSVTTQTALYNCYQDRAGAIRAFPGLAQYAEIVAGGGMVYGYFSTLYNIHLIVCDGRIFKQTLKNGPLTEITGATLDYAAEPTFTEDSTYIYVAARSAIYRILPSGTTAEALGEIVAETPAETTFTVEIVIEGADPNPQLVTLKSDGAASIYYTVDGTTPNNTKTLYTLGSKISVETTSELKAIAYDGDGNASEVAMHSFIVAVTILTAPTIHNFEVGTVVDNSVVITSFYTSDAYGTTAYIIMEDTVDPPALDDPKWSSNYGNQKFYSRTPTAGTRALVPWARNAFGNVATDLSKAKNVTFGDAVYTPNPFSFADVTDTKRSVDVESEAIAPTGFTFETTLSISGGEYALSKDSGLTFTNWRTASGTIDMGDVVKVRHTSSASNLTSTMTTLTIGGVEGTFTSTTADTQLPRLVEQLNYLGGYLLAKGQPAVGDAVPGDILYSDDKDNNYAAWEVFNNESRPDGLQKMIVAWEQIFAIGRETLEVSFNDGVTPFAANKTAFQNFGTMAPNSVAFNGESIYFLTTVAGARKIIEFKAGGAPSTISTQIETLLENMTDLTTANGYHMAFRGQNFYMLECPDANITVDGQVYESITLAYHLQKQSWIVVGKWDVNNAVYGKYRGHNAYYIEPWGITIVCGRDGKLYTFSSNSIDYTKEPVLSHRWQDDHVETWKNPRIVKLYPIGQRKFPIDIRQCGRYRYRRHEIVYTDKSDVGETFRAAIKTGWVDHGSTNYKFPSFYRYNVKTGAEEMVINSIVEEVEEGSY